MTEYKPFRKEWTLDNLQRNIDMLEEMISHAGDLGAKAAERRVALLRKELYLVSELVDDEIFIQKRYHIVKSLNYPNMLDD